MTTIPPAALTVVSPPAHRPRWWRWGPRSLTGRLVSGVVALVVVLVVAIGTSTYFALQSFLYNRLDQQVVATANQPINRILGPSAIDPDAPSPQTIWIIQLDTNGGVLDSLPNLGHVRHMNLETADRARFADGQLRPSSVTTADGDRLRVVAVQQPRIAGVVVVGLSTTEVVTTLHRLFLLELAMGGAAVALTLIATGYGVRWSLRRLRAVTATAHEVAAELSPTGAGLQRRVPVSADDTGTEVGQLAESMNTLLAAVETQFAARVASEERMRQFLADASHELRTPLTSIRGYAELARMQREQHGADAEPANLERIESEGTRMSRLVDDLLTLARSDQAAAGGAQAEIIDLTELLADAVEGARAAFADREISLSAEDGLTVLGDRDALLQVVRNLITNAAVHTRPDGPIEVRAFADGHYAVVQVIDAGPGLPPEDAAHVFERFWRADKARSRARGGSGLGMAIVASTVQAHGGLVRFDSTVEDGSTVTVWLPSATG